MKHVSYVNAVVGGVNKELYVTWYVFCTFYAQFLCCNVIYRSFGVYTRHGTRCTHMYESACSVFEKILPLGNK